jgi:enoyl-CoA hydratase/carnithine racemase
MIEKEPGIRHSTFDRTDAEVTVTRSGEGSEPAVLVEEMELGVDVGEAGTSRVAVVLTLSRPERLNAIDWEMLRQLDTVIEGLAQRSDLCCLLVTGAGRAFSAGGDLDSYVELQRDPVAFPRFVADIHRVFGRLRDLPVPVVALVNGVTAAGGLELVLNCDFALIARSARIADGHLNFGQMGGGGVLTLLPRVVGLQRASELIFSGRFLSADEAVEWGLAIRSVDDAELVENGVAFARQVALKSPLSVANAKAVLQGLWAANGDLTSGLRFERERNAYYCLTSRDAPEGLQAFRENRPPRFLGR